MSHISKMSALVLAIGLVAGAVIGLNLNQPASAVQAGGAGGTSSAPYSVVMTDGTHLVVTSNKTNTLYFYSIEKDAEIGSDLKLRGKVDLSQVGKDVITPTIMFKKK